MKRWMNKWNWEKQFIHVNFQWKRIFFYSFQEDRVNIFLVCVCFRDDKTNMLFVTVVTDTLKIRHNHMFKKLALDQSTTRKSKPNRDVKSLESQCPMGLRTTCRFCDERLVKVLPTICLCFFTAHAFILKPFQLISDSRHYLWLLWPLKVKSWWF